jgi:lysophospholipase L1-like esterase
VNFRSARLSPVRLLGIAGIAAVVLSAAGASRAGGAEPAGESASPSLLQTGDRLGIVGGTFVERMQGSGCFEARLHERRPELQLTTRNLGWSGDNVAGRARAGFGAPAEGYDRLQRDIAAADPSVMLVAYGFAEAVDGMPTAVFRSGLERLVVDLHERGTRVLLLLPFKLPGVRTDGYDPSLAAIRKELVQYADAAGLPVIDVAEAVESLEQDDWQPLGMHLSPRGYATVAAALADQLAGPSTEPLRPADLDRLCEAIAEKDELFFHRYRPQNETYLFLFRKHEQGNNAVEIPAFDPLIEQAEREIRQMVEEMTQG